LSQVFDYPTAACPHLEIIIPGILTKHEFMDGLCCRSPFFFVRKSYAIA